MNIQELFSLIQQGNSNRLRYDSADQVNGAIRRGEYFTGQFSPEGESNKIPLMYEPDEAARRTGGARRTDLEGTEAARTLQGLRLLDSNLYPTTSNAGYRVQNSRQDPRDLSRSGYSNFLIDDQHMDSWNQLNSLIERQGKSLSRPEIEDLKHFATNYFIENDMATEYELDGKGNVTGNYRRGLAKLNNQYRRDNNIPENAVILAESKDIRGVDSQLGYNPKDPRFVSLEDPESQADRRYYSELVSGGDYVAMRDAARRERGNEAVPEFSLYNSLGQRYLGPNARTVASMPRKDVIRDKDPKDYL